jgi:hypothetical protein
VKGIAYGERLRGCNPRNLNPEKARGVSPELQAALEPLLAAIESLSDRIHEYNQQIREDRQGTLFAKKALELHESVPSRCSHFCNHPSNSIQSANRSIQ